MPSTLAIFSFSPLINLVGVLICGAVSVICAFLSKSSGHAPVWMDVPALHLIGFRDPEASLFSAGCTASAILLLFSGAMYHMLIHACQSRHQVPQKHDGAARFLNLASFSFHAVACIALSVQACCPVQSDIVHTYFGYSALNDKTRFHQAAAACWWISAALHEVLFIVALFVSPALSFMRRLKTFKLRVALVSLSLVCCAVSHIATIPASKVVTGLTTHQVNTTTICSMWISASAFVAALLLQSWESALILERIGIHPLLFGSSSTKRDNNSEQSVGLTSTKTVEDEEEAHSA